MTGQKKTNVRYEQDEEMYQEFLRELNKGTLTKSNPVYRLIIELAWQLCWWYNRLNDVEDLSQEALTALAKNQYQKNSSLRTYIRTIMINQIKRWWKKSSNIMIVQFDEDTQRQADRQAFIAAEIKRRMFKDEDLREELSKLPNLQKTIVLVILRLANKQNKQPSVRDIVKEMNESDPEHKVSRYAVSTELKRLKHSLGSKIFNLC